MNAVLASVSPYLVTNSLGWLVGVAFLVYAAVTLLAALVSVYLKLFLIKRLAKASHAPSLSAVRLVALWEFLTLLLAFVLIGDPGSASPTAVAFAHFIYLAIALYPNLRLLRTAEAPEEDRRPNLRMWAYAVLFSLIFPGLRLLFGLLLFRTIR